MPIKKTSDLIHPNRRQFLKSAVLSGAGMAASGISVEAATNHASKKLVLAKAGESTYSILVSATAPPAEQRAAAELQRFIHEMTGVRVPIVGDAPDPHANLILVGDSPALQRLGLNIPFGELGTEGFVLQTAGANLVIAGGKPRGTMYGVYALLDRLGCRWCTPDVSVIPKRPTLVLKPLNETQKPAFEYREPSFTESIDKDWSARNRINGSSQKLDESTGGKIDYFPFVHSFYRILPPKEYFQQHPEYYALVDGKRRGEDAQLCLTNADVLRLTIQKVLSWIAEHPEASIFSVSQNDTQGWCECANCLRVEQEEGGAHSGPILRFVNAVATEVGKSHPDKLIDTLAYWYSEPPPSNARPVPNVRIRLCPIGVCEAHPYGQCDYDRYFLDHLRAWGKITNQLYIWHYVTNFAHYLMPFPDFDELAADIPLYQKNGVVGIFLEGDSAPGGGGENAELRSYVMARLLWNPGVDVDEAVNEFMDAFYGKAARPMRAYFDLQHRQVRLPPRGNGNHMWIFINPGSPYLPQEFLTEATKLLVQAQSLANDDATRRRVQKARLSIDYVKLIRAEAFIVRNGTYAPEDLHQVKQNFQKVMSDARSFGITHLLEVTPIDESEKLLNRNIKPYPAVTLENANLRVVVVPELTGRIISIVDKSTSTEAVRHPIPGERHYPDTSGVVAYASDDYLQAKSYDAAWQLAESAEVDRIHLVGNCEEGLTLRRTITLLPDKPVIRTETLLENTRTSAIDAVLSARYDAAPGDLKRSQVIFRSQTGEDVKKTIVDPGVEPAGSHWYAASEQPDGEWSVTGEDTPMVIVNRFDKDQVARSSVNWSGKADSRVTLNLWSPKRKLAPRDTLKLDVEYEIRKA